MCFQPRGRRSDNRLRLVPERINAEAEPPCLFGKRPIFAILDTGLPLLSETSSAVRKLAVLPTLLTLGNAVCGFSSIAIASSIKGENDPNANVCYLTSAILIF